MTTENTTRFNFIDKHVAALHDARPSATIGLVSAAFELDASTRAELLCEAVIELADATAKPRRVHASVPESIRSFNHGNVPLWAEVEDEAGPAFIYQLVGTTHEQMAWLVELYSEGWHVMFRPPLKGSSYPRVVVY